MLFYQIILIN